VVRFPEKGGEGPVPAPSVAAAGGAIANGSLVGGRAQAGLDQSSGNRRQMAASMEAEIPCQHAKSHHVLQGAAYRFPGTLSYLLE